MSVCCVCDVMNICLSRFHVPCPPRLPVIDISCVRSRACACVPDVQADPAASPHVLFPGNFSSGGFKKIEVGGEHNVYALERETSGQITLEVREEHAKHVRDGGILFFLRWRRHTTDA